MNEIAQYKLDVIARLLEPDFRRRIEPDEVANALKAIRRSGLVTTEELAALWGMSRGAIANRFSKTGVLAADRKGHKGAYRWADVYRAYPEKIPGGITGEEA